MGKKKVNKKISLKKIKKINKKHIIIALFLLVLFFLIIKITNFEKKNVRKSVFSGTWYPGTADNLNEAIDEYFNNVVDQEIDGEVKGLIVPHAGYVYSGQVAATGFRHLNGDYETVMLLGPSHRYALNGVSILDVTYYETPLGKVKISKKVKDMLKEDIISSIPEAHANEHSLEIELPFLQKQLGEFELIPILVGPVDMKQFLDVLMKYYDDKTLIVVSADLSHYHTYDEAIEKDVYCMNTIHNLDFNGLESCEIDAPWAIASLMYFAQQKNWENDVLMYKNSGDVTGDKSSVVGYSAIAFYKEEMSKENKEFLLKLARDTIENYLKDGKVPKVDESKLDPSLLEVKGCFVTLEERSSLRGCIGHIMPQEKLYKCIIDNAISASSFDTRFMPLTYDEFMEGVNIEISVLTVPKPLEFDDSEDLLNKLQKDKDGVVLQYNSRGATYLPSVWKQLPDKKVFLSSLCQKSGNEADCWQKDGLKIDIYHTLGFSEEGFDLH